MTEFTHTMYVCAGKIEKGLSPLKEEYFSPLFFFLHEVPLTTYYIQLLNLRKKEKNK